MTNTIIVRLPEEYISILTRLARLVTKQPPGEYPDFGSLFAVLDVAGRTWEELEARL